MDATKTISSSSSSSTRKRMTTESESLDGKGSHTSVCIEEKPKDATMKNDEMRLANHVSVAKRFILRTFNDTSNRKPIIYTEYWDELASIQWQDDLDICCAATKRGLEAKRLLKVKNIHDPDFISKIFACTINKDQAQGVWDIMSNDLKENKDMLFIALK